VGNLPYNTTEHQLRSHLGAVGDVVNVAIPIDRATGRPRGFAFVEFASEEQATQAIGKFDGQDFEGRPLRVNMAEDRPRRPFSPGGPPPGGPRPSFAQPFPDDRDDGGGGGGNRGGGGGGFGDRRPRGNSKGSRRGLRARKRSL
jgi:RNA recognition motif-containing protein